MRDWLLRTCEIIDNYSNDVMYFDWWIGKSSVWQPYVKKLAAFYYNKMVAAGKMGVINTKDGTMPTGTDVLDFERGQACTIQKNFWQTDTSISGRSWGYIEGDYYKSAASMIGNLVDIVSKNGALMMNVGPAPNGTIPADAVNSFLKIGTWLQEAGEAIYGTRPYHVFAEGPTIMGCGSFSSEVVDFKFNDFRFTAKNDTVFALAMGATGGEEVVVNALGTAIAASGNISAVEVLGHGAVPFTVDATGLRVLLPQNAGIHGPPVLAVRGLSDTKWDGAVRQGADGSYRLTATNTASMQGGASLESLKDCTGVLSGDCSALSVSTGSSVTWNTKKRSTQTLVPKVTVSSPSGSGILQLVVGNSLVNITIPQTEANEYVQVVGSHAILVETDANITFSSVVSPAPAPPPSSQEWVVEDGVSHFWGCKVDGQVWLDLGKQSDKDACHSACVAAENCQVWTWHHSDQGSWANLCVGRTDGGYVYRKESGHDSGRLNTTHPVTSCTNAGGKAEIAAITLVPSTVLLV